MLFSQMSSLDLPDDTISSMNVGRDARQAEAGHAEVVSMLLAKQGVDVNQATNDGFTPLYIASENGHAEVVST